MARVIEPQCNFLRREIQNESDNVPYLKSWNSQAKLNYNWDDNANPNYGSVVVIVSFEFLKYFSQPPAILPISCSCPCKFKYDLEFKVLLSFAILKRIGDKIGQPLKLNQSLQSYLGYLSHAKSFKLSQDLKNLFFLKHEF